MIGSATINLPMRSYLKKYLVKSYGDSYTATRDSWFGMYLVNVLNKDFKKPNLTKPLDKENFYPVIIPVSWVNKDGFSISSQRYHSLQTIIRKVFYNALYSYVDISINSELRLKDVKHGSIVRQNRNKAIEQFLYSYEINEDDLKFESVYRQVTRYFDKK